MIILAIDTAASLCAACVYDAAADAEQGRVVLDLGKGHAEHVMAVIETALEKACIGYGDLSAVAVNIGPGSFTGVRVGVSAARGVALALRIPAIGVNALEALAEEARAAHPGKPVLAVTGNRADNLGMALFDAGGLCVEGPASMTLERVAEVAARKQPVLAGDAAERVAEKAGGGFAFGPKAATADIVIYARLAARRGADGGKPKPLYLRQPDAKPQSGFAIARKAE